MRDFIPGICVDCGKPCPRAGGRKRCYPCQAIYMDEAKRIRDKHKVRKKDLRKRLGKPDGPSAEEQFAVAMAREVREI